MNDWMRHVSELREISPPSLLPSFPLFFLRFSTFRWVGESADDDGALMSLSFPFLLRAVLRGGERAYSGRQVKVKTDSNAWDCLFFSFFFPLLFLRRLL